MKKQDFIKELSEELELETVVTIASSIKDLDEWDSMGAMILIAYVSDTFDVTLDADDIESITTFNSLIERIGEEKFLE
jgi:acyl carrier protein